MKPGVVFRPDAVQSQSTLGFGGSPCGDGLRVHVDDGSQTVVFRISRRDGSRNGASARDEIHRRVHSAFFDIEQSQKTASSGSIVTD